MVYIERLVVWLAEGPVLSRLQIECNVKKVSLGEVDIGGYFQAMMIKKLDDFFLGRSSSRPEASTIAKPSSLYRPMLVLPTSFARW